ncbi:MAG: biotin/lipoyl-binding protein [Microthrixaceae bacterium]
MLRTAEQAMRLKAAELQLLKRSRIPSLNATGLYGTTGFGPIGAENRYDFYPIGYFGAQLQVPLFQGTVLGKRIKSKELELEHAALQRDAAGARRAGAPHRPARRGPRPPSARRQRKRNWNWRNASAAAHCCNTSRAWPPSPTSYWPTRPCANAQQNTIDALVQLRKAQLELARLNGTLLNTTPMKRWMIWIALAALLAAHRGEAGMNKRMVEERVYRHDKSAPVHVGVDTVRVGGTADDRPYGGTVVATREGRVMAEVPGRVLSVDVQEGEWVERGAVIARLDGELLRLQQEAAQVQVATLEKDQARYTILAEADAVQGVQLEKTDVALETARIQLANMNRTTAAHHHRGTVQRAGGATAGGRRHRGRTVHARGTTHRSSCVGTGAAGNRIGSRSLPGSAMRSRLPQAAHGTWWVRYQAWAIAVMARTTSPCASPLLPPPMMRSDRACRLRCRRRAKGKCPER